VSSINVDSGGCTLIISDATPILGDCHVGDSVAVNGACLTVTEFEKDELGGWFKVWLANETLQRTDLGEAHPSMGDSPVGLMATQGNVKWEIGLI
jgi:riboflavin synthase